MMDTTINSNKNNNNNNNSFNEDNEKVFWKVIHNKFLFNIIFEFIVTVDQGSFKSHKQIHIDNRKKFKDIDSLQWMLINNQYELLKCKLQNNEYINFDGIIQFVLLGIDKDEYKVINKRVIKKEQIKNGTYNKEGEDEEKNNEDEESEENEEEYDEDFKLFNELLYLIFIKHGDRYKQLIDTDVLLVTASTVSAKLFQLLVNEPYSLRIKNSKHTNPFLILLYRLIQTKSPQTVDVIIKSIKDIEITEEFKNQSIYLAFKNEEYQEPMISYILSNPQLYNKSNKDDIKNNLNNNNKQSNKRIKMLNGDLHKVVQSDSDSSDSDFDDDDDDDDYDDDDSESPEIDPTAIVKIGIDQFITIKSPELQNQLLDLNYVYVNSMLDSINNVDSLKEMINSGCDNDDNHSRGGRLKEIYKILVKGRIVKYDDYLEKYNQVIGGLDITTALQYALTKFSTSILKSLLSNEYITDYIGVNIKLIQNKMNSTLSYDYPTNNLTIEFIQLLTSSQCTHSIISDPNYGKYLLSNYLKSNEKYQEIIQIFTSSTVSKEYKELLPLTWNELMYQLVSYGGEKLIIIKDKETIDWIIDNIDKSRLLRLKLKRYKDGRIIQFESLELFNYATEKFNSNSILSTPLTTSTSFHNYLFFKYIGECNIDGLKSINPNPEQINVHLIFHIRFLEEINKLSKQSIENIIKLLKYLNETGFKNFTEYYHDKMICAIHKNLSILPDVDDNHGVIYGFHQFGSMVHHRMLISITEIKPSIIKTILNEYNSFEDNNSSETIHFFNTINLSNEVKIGKKPKFKTEDTISSDIIKCIEIFLNLINSNIKEKFNQVYSSIINYLFKRLIQSKNTTIDQVKQVYNLITIHNSTTTTTVDLSKEVKLQHSLFQVWYCLAIRSPILIKYILELPFFTSHARNYENGDVDDGDIVYDGYHIKKYLDLSVFTFDFISGAQVDEILEALVYHLSIKPFLEDPEMANHVGEVSELYCLPVSLNSNLEFFLITRRVDLLFKHLSLIQSMLETNSKIKSDPREFSAHGGNLNHGRVREENKKVNGEGETDLICQQCNDDVDIKPISKPDKVFYYINALFYNACKVLDSQQLQKFVKFCSFHSIRDCILNYVAGFDNLVKIYKTINHIFTYHNPKKYGLKDKNYRQFWDEYPTEGINFHTIMKHKELLFSGELISQQRIIELSKLLQPTEN